MNVNDIYSILIALGIVLSLVAICVVFALYLMKNKIYSSGDNNAANVDIVKESVKEQEKMSKEYEILKAIDTLRKSRKTITINEIKIACVKENKEYEEFNFQYIFTKLRVMSGNKVKFKKIGKTHHLNLEHLGILNYTISKSKNTSVKYSNELLADIVYIGIKTLAKKIDAKSYDILYANNRLEVKC